MEYRLEKNLTASAAVIKLAARTLQAGGVAVLPTDTIYGLSGRASSLKAIRRIKSLKGNESAKPLLVLISSLAMARKYVFISDRQATLLRKYWHSGIRPTTVILRHRGRLPRLLTGASDGLALRLPKSRFLIKMIRTLKEPLISTSFNRSGEEPLRDPLLVATVWPDKGKQPDLVIDAGPVRRQKTSRLIDLRNPSAPRVLRP